MDALAAFPPNGPDGAGLAALAGLALAAVEVGHGAMKPAVGQPLAKGADHEPPPVRSRLKAVVRLL